MLEQLRLSAATALLLVVKLERRITGLQLRLLERRGQKVELLRQCVAARGGRGLGGPPELLLQRLLKAPRQLGREGVGLPEPPEEVRHLVL